MACAPALTIVLPITSMDYTNPPACAGAAGRLAKLCEEPEDGRSERGSQRGWHARAACSAYGKIGTLMRFRFNERKAAEAAAHLLAMRGGKMHYIKLLKLLYLADRQCLIETGFTITGDRMVSMPKGPVLSEVYDLILEEPRDPGASPWLAFVSPPTPDYKVELRQQPPAIGELSDYEIGILRGVFGRYGGMYRFDLVDLVHELPEWEDPHGSSLPIEPAKILWLAGQDRVQITTAVAEAEHAFLVDVRSTGPH
jgi:hypothetical protein